MRKNIQGVMSLMLVLLLLIPSLVMAESNINLDYNQTGDKVTIDISGDENRSVSITVKDESRYYYIDQGITNDQGKISFETTLKKGESYDCNVNIDGKVVNKKISMELDSDSKPKPNPNPEKKNLASLYIKGYKKVTLDKSNIKIKSGETALDFTTRLLDENDIDYTESKGYISMIDGQKEFDKGKDSGWMFSVNGKYPDVGAGKVRVKSGDKIEWLYTYDLGKDIGGSSSVRSKVEDEKISNPIISDALKVIKDKKSTEKDIIKAIDNMVKDLGDKKSNLDSKEIRILLGDNTKASEVLLKGLDRIETEKLAINIGENAINLTKNLDKILANKNDSIEKLGAISRENMGIALDSINKIKNKDEIKNIVNDIFDISIKIESELSKVKANKNRNIEKTIGIKLVEDKDNNSNNILSSELFKKAIEKNLDKIKISSDSISLEVSPDFLGKDIKDDIKIKLENKASIRTIEIKEGNKSLNKVDKPIKIILPYNEKLVNKDNLTVELIKKDGSKELIGGMYDESTKTVKFITNKLGNFTVRENNVSFKDLSAYNWAEKAINSMASKGIINGRSEEKFDPSAKITRAEFSTLISRTLKLNEDLDERVEFKDIKQDAWYSKPVLAIYQNGLVNGKSSDSFDPEGNITREEMAKIIGKVLENNLYKSQDTEVLEQFTDVDSISKWAKEGSAIAVYNKLINGDNGKFMPNKDATRAETATILYRLYGLIMD